MSSADQDAWVDLATAIRTQILKQVPLMAAMSPDEVKGFVDTAQAAYWLEQNARLFDKKIEDEQHKLFCDS